MIYDTFIFFNELDLLELRLNVLDNHVDYFVLVEATETFQGAPKPLYFAENKDRFSRFLGKIVHVVVDDMPHGAAPFDREYHQRDCILRGVQNCRPDDLILLSDVDEIPNPERIPTNLAEGLRLAFEQPLYYYRLNRKCVQMDHLPWSVLTHYCTFGFPSQLRRDVVKLQSDILSHEAVTDRFEIIKEGGWHFSYLGSPENIVKKIEAFSHAEYNRPGFKNVGALADCISNGRDLFGRDLIFITADMQELPQYVRENREKYESMNYLEAEAQKTNLGVMSNTIDLLFDQYSRYRACAELLLRLGATARSRILDVGSGSACLLSEFLPGFDISYVDPVIKTLPTKKSNQFGFQIDEVADKLGVFDYVVAIDVLEHVPPQFREGFTSTLAALATKSIVLAFPYEDGQGPVEVDRAINADYAYINKRSYSWLEEHDTYGLPNAEKLKSEFSKCGMDAEFFYHGYAPWLEELLSYVINVNDIRCAKVLGHQVSREFNRKLYEYDFNQPAYRVFLVASRSALPAGWEPTRKSIDSYVERQFKSIMRDAYLRLIAQLQTADREMLEAKASASAALVDREAALAQAEALQKQNQQANELIMQMRSSNSWRLTKPLRFAARVKRNGLSPDDRRSLGQVLRKSFRRMPLPDAARNGLRWLYQRHVKRLLAPRSSPVMNVPFLLPSLMPAARNEELPDYVMWGVIDWHFRFQRPQQLATALAAAGRRVVYISPAFIPDGRAGFDIEQLDAGGRLFQAKLFVSTAPTIYFQAPTMQELEQIQASLGALLEWLNPRQIESVVQHPFWYEVAMVLPNSRVVYDCMDHHDGFGNNAMEISVLEDALIKHADLTITTSDWLDKETGKLTGRRALIRNAGDYAHFSKAPATVYRDPQFRKIIGYYGAIAEWFDQDLVEAVARAFPDCCILLIGADSVNAQRRLSNLPNVKFKGEVSYQELPFYLHGFDACMLPFKIIPLTLATNPVKVYEYLSAGKPVVSVDLPEIAQCEGLVQVGTTHDEFVNHLAAELAQDPSEEQEVRRRSFAAGQTWEHRVRQLIADVEGKKDDPIVSIIVVTYNNLALTQTCLASIDAYSDYANLEIIVVDNASSDGSPAYLTDWVKGAPNRRLILNPENSGFAAGNNLGLAAASGEYLVLLNNDTHVTPGWVRTMTRHLQRNPKIGLIGPVTNNIGNEAKIDITYDDMPQMLVESTAYTRRHIGQLLPLRTAAFFCVMMPRATYEQVGDLDEAFGRGFFEDDDYCRRVEQIGKEVVCAEDVFIHHHLSASFNKLKQVERQKLFEQNKLTYEAKWGKWRPHEFRKK